MRLKQVIKNTLKKIYFGCFTVKNIPKINRLNKWIPSALIHFSLMDSHPKTAEDYFACNDSTPFTDLAPIDSADSDGTYSKALHYAFSNPQIKNIALSGPYGSGKSSIIKTYEKKSSLNFLNISLASFKEDDGNSEKEFIERSILQQMLYGADANKLPHSRFKRISTPELPLLKSGIIILWLILSIFLYYYRNEWVILESYSSCWWNLILAFVISLPIILLSDFYKASFGLSLKKFSLKNAEIETADIPDDSILNRHLDEIIYFFQVTDYDVVVIEDLDRFGNPEIFVKLREINKIINDNNKNHNQVKFLYALKDDMFAQNNRAKFFDFIIPVVPVINRSNSLDKILEHLHEHDFAKSIDSQFLREVSLYIDDLRLIRNIFNEFTIYYDRLKSESLDATKLLAMMIYKNVYPDDFENLHHGQGILFEICQEKNEYLRKSKDQLKDKINETRISIESANDEQARDIRGLIETYIGHIVMSVNEPVSGFFFDNKRYVSFSQLATFEKFKPLLVENNIMLSKLPNNHHQNRVPTNKPFSQFEEEINPGETFLSRKENIENNSESQKNELQQKIKRLKEDVLGLAQIQFFQLIQNCAIDFEKLFEKYKITDGNLLIYLVKNGNTAKLAQ
ncbi:YobI family P-loop NTPase [Candidatus Electrothrix sp.]|uniref:YobI family P-loop NTPase n=2 Tax=Candidatus Electrothrix sp. TaxID=2170559 RepID=UPI004056C075